jgi:hypothetical protein
MPTYSRPPRLHRTHQLPAPVPDWSKLSRGDVVKVFPRNGLSTVGQIDMLSLDRSVFWILQEGGRGRMMVCSADKPKVVAVAQGDGERRSGPEATALDSTAALP